MTTAQASRHRRLFVLGSTGSIGCNTLDVVAQLNAAGAMHFDVVGLATGANTAALADQASRFNVPNVAVARCDHAQVNEINSCRAVFTGEDAAEQLINAAAQPGDLVVGAMVGAAGIPATLAAIERGCDVALANKETLAAAGALVMPRVHETGVRLLPIDSEHSAIFQCLQAGRSIEEVRRLVITASGGPFRASSLEEINSATLDQALAHPTWNMGAKNTIDSATMMNKALEIMEAHWLFGLPVEKIDAIVHPQSIVHSFVEFVDGAVFAQLSPPDMKLPIQYALTCPARLEGTARRVDWSDFRNLEFEPVDHDRFPALALAWRALEMGGTAGAVLNAANEQAVKAFEAGEITVGRIAELVRGALDAIGPDAFGPADSLRAIEAADEAGRRHVQHQLADETKPTMETSAPRRDSRLSNASNLSRCPNVPRRIQ